MKEDLSFVFDYQCFRKAVGMVRTFMAFLISQVSYQGFTGYVARGITSPHIGPNDVGYTESSQEFSTN